MGNQVEKTKNLLHLSYSFWRYFLFVFIGGRRKQITFVIRLQRNILVESHATLECRSLRKLSLYNSRLFLDQII